MQSMEKKNYISTKQHVLKPSVYSVLFFNWPPHHEGILGVEV